MNEQKKSKIASSILRKVKEHVHEYLGYGEGPEETFRKLFLEKTRGCLPDEFIGDDINKSIYGKYYAVAHALRLELSQRKKIDQFDLRIVIEPSYEDSTSVDYIYQPTPPGGVNSVRGFVIHTLSMKPWHYYFETLDEFNEFIYGEYRQLDQGYEAAKRLLKGAR